MHSLTPMARFGRFLLLERVKSGGMAEIWLARDEAHHHYALRVMHEGLESQRVARRRFQHGCEVLAQLQPHPMIVRYYEHGRHRGRHYLVMEYVEGENLKERLARVDPVVAENVAQLLLDMAAALEHMHVRGYMHLDFKPENVLVTASGNIRLIDFDLAQPIPPTPQPLDRNPGTPNYMAPEQLLRQALDQRVDIFAYGVTAYELLTHQKPFEGTTPDEILRRQQDPAGPRPPRELNPDIPPGLERILLRCLQPDPARRYGLMSHLRHDLELVLYR
ncbi:MAG: serine/threonine-protein kinase [Verrucomicrobiota bacterium]|nr:serine/threonine protein kinase [Limisphaera sp.]MDW8382125.1 serine/threonine-protein kinase [Verrucomicrobiota bacterium]